MLMIDGCSGLKTASKAMLDRGWSVVTIDNDPSMQPDIVADIRSWSWLGPRPDLLWFSPPCTEFAREFMPWSRTGNPPDLSIVNACKRIVAESQPRYWVIENVKGAVKYLGKPSYIRNPFYLWGFFPYLGKINLTRRKKESYTSSRAAERAMIPYELSLAVAQAIESAISFFDQSLITTHYSLFTEV